MHGFCFLVANELYRLTMVPYIPLSPIVVMILIRGGPIPGRVQIFQREADFPGEGADFSRGEGFIGASSSSFF